MLRITDKIRNLFFLIFILSSGLTYAQPAGQPLVCVGEQDGNPSVNSLCVYGVKFSNGTVTDNGDGTASVSNTGGGGATSPGGLLGAVQYNSPAGSFAGDESKFSFNGNNVGIGTSNATSTLDIRDTIAVMTFVSTTGTNAAYTTFSNSGGGLIAGIDSSTGGYINADAGPYETSFGSTGLKNFNLMWNNGTRAYIGGGDGRFIIPSNNVGIGSLNPERKLVVAGGFLKTDGFILPNNGAANGNVLVTNAIGVGTWMPASTLPISGGGSGTVNSGVANFYGRYPSTGTTIDDSAVTMDDGTNVGMGTTLPKALLNINSSSAQDLFRVDDSAGNDATPFIIDQTGNVGIGTAVPLAVLSVSSTASQTLFRVDDNGNGDLSPFIIDANGNVGIGTTNTERDALLVMSGNVGIGTWVPSTKLDVAGTIVSTQIIDSGLTASRPVISDTNKQLSSGSYSGNTTTIVTTTGTQTSGDCVKIDANGNHIANGSPCGSGGSSQWITAAGVGIGTVDKVGISILSPINQLDVSGATAMGTYAGANLAPTNGLIISGNLGVGTHTPTATFQVTPGVNTVITMVPNGGNVGIGTTLSINRVDINGSVAIGGVNAGYQAAPSGGLITNGNVGIGTFFNLNGLDLYANAAIGLSYAGYKTATVNGLIVQGNTGLGTFLPNDTLSVGGNSSIGAAYSTIAAPANGLLVQGLMGVGTTIPTQTLEVKGTFSVRGAGTSPFTMKSAVNQACNTTCNLSQCSGAEDTSVIGTFVSCSDATADNCFCMGP